MLAARAVDQRIVATAWQRERSLGERRAQVSRKLALCFFRQLPQRDRRLLHRPGVTAGVIERGIAFEGLAAWRGAQPHLERVREVRQERLVQHVAVSALRLGVQLFSLVQPPMQRPGRVGLAQLAQTAEQRHQARFVAGANRRQAIELALRRAGVIAGRRHQGAVTEEARGPGKRQRDAERGDGGVRGHACQSEPALLAGSHAREPGFAEDHLAQQPAQEEALSAADVGRLHFALEVEAARQGAEHAIDGAAFLRAAGEVNAAQQRRLAGPAAAEGRVEEARDGRPARAKLLRKAVDRGAALQVALFLQPPRQQRVEPALEVRELLVEAHRHRTRLRGQLARVESRAPDLRAALGVELGEELVEAREQVRLGDHHVHRQPHAEPRVELPHALAHVPRVAQVLVLAPVRQVRHAQRDDHAVERLARAKLLQQLEKAEPGRAVGLAVAFLSGVAARGVEQHGLVGEPPIAVARAADALQRALGARIAERKAQPGVEQRGGLARAGGADEHVPGQLGDRAALAAGAAEARLAQHGERVLEALAQHRDLVLGALGRVFARRAAGEALEQPLVFPQRLARAPQLPAEPGRGYRSDQREALHRAVERPPAA